MPMSVTRRRILERLAAASDATGRETTTVEALTAALDADEGTVESRIEGLEAYSLARIAPDGTVRVTITGEELLELDADEAVVIDVGTPNSDP